MKMEINLNTDITIRDLAEGYVDNGDDGVTGYGGRLDIRPAFQRRFVYEEKERNAVIDSVMEGFPLNTMYWSVCDGGFELLDGQQRTISICQYVSGKFSYKGKYFHSLTDGEQNKILDYALSIYICEGEEEDKLKWFEVINIAGKTLTKQELRNAIFTGPWVSDAKRYFSSSKHSKADKMAKGYVKKKLVRQEYLELAIKWDLKPKQTIENYMSEHQYKETASALWMNYTNIVVWAKTLFPKSNEKLMTLTDWGGLYKEHGHKSFNPEKLAERVSKLILDKEIGSMKGIYSYLISGEEKYLNLRGFDLEQKAQMYEIQKGKCYDCEEEFHIDDMEGEHIKPWSQDGKTDLDNGCMVCLPCHKERTRLQLKK